MNLSFLLELHTKGTFDLSIPFTFSTTDRTSDPLRTDILTRDDLRTLNRTPEPVHSGFIKFYNRSLTPTPNTVPLDTRRTETKERWVCMV